jgi:hypothetical protein
MTNHEFELRQYVIRLRGIIAHHADPSAIRAAQGLFDAIDATLEQMDTKDWRKKLKE